MRSARREVILSRAAKLGGAPTVASRFVQRLAAVAGKQRWDAALERGARYAALARRLDETGTPETRHAAGADAARSKRGRASSASPRSRTCCATPIRSMPSTCSSSRRSTTIDTPPGAADRGTVIHDAIGEFGKTFPKQLPADPVRAMTEIGEKHFKPLSDYPEARAFWWPRFQRIAQWFARFEAGRRASLKTFDVEIGGQHRDPVRQRQLHADRARRPHRVPGRTGATPSSTTRPASRRPKRRCAPDLSPQLTLEAAILRQGGFKDIPAGGSVAELLYVRLRGGAEAGRGRPIEFKEGTPDDAGRPRARRPHQGAGGNSPIRTKPYYSLLHPMWTTHYGTYDHLARVQGMVADRRRR